MDSNPNTSTNPRQPLPSSPRGKPEHGMAKVEGGFPHSEIRGSMPVRGSPRLIAAYHVLHRLSAPRHPPDTLMTLDHSHHRCPTGKPKGSHPEKNADARPRRLDRASVQLAGAGPKDLCFQTCPRRGAVKLPVTGPHRAQAVSRRTHVAAGSAHKAGPLAMLMHVSAGQTVRSDTFTLHDVEQHAPPQRAGDAPAGASRTANSMDADEAQGALGSRGSRLKGLDKGTAVPPPCPAPHGVSRGGARRDRTDDLMLAKHALSQLSYCPKRVTLEDGRPRSDWWAWEDSNFRPHAYQARALTN